MKIGFLTACLGREDLEEQVIPWAKNNGFNTLEIGGAHAAFFKRDFIEDIDEIIKESGIEVSAIGNFRNWLEGDEKQREMNWNDLKSSIDAASGLKVPCVTTFVGINNKLDYKGNLEMFKKEWIPIIEYARERNIKIAIENCPMKGAYGLNGGNLMFTPGIMGDLFSISPDNFGLNFDPSHLYWQNVNVDLIVEEFCERIFHTHAKDTQINKERLEFEGTLGNGIYTFRLPGLGEINWESYIDTLKDNGYNGVLSIELEDPNYEKSYDKVKEGLVKSREFLEKII